MSEDPPKKRLVRSPTRGQDVGRTAAVRLKTAKSRTPSSQAWLERQLNDPFVVRQCEHIATRLSAKAATPPEQAEAAFETILLRKARADEAAKFAAYIEQHGLANACQLLVNSSEFLYLD